MAGLPLILVLILIASSGCNSVLVGTMVEVSQDGIGNFTIVHDAILKAQNDTDGTKRYFIIHVTASVYKEYVLNDDWR